MVYKVSFYPGFGSQWRATHEKPAILYTHAKNSEEARELARRECLLHTVEPFICFQSEEVDSKKVPKDAEWCAWCPESGSMAHEKGRIIDSPDASIIDDKSKPASDSVVFTPLTKWVKNSLQGQGQEVTMDPMDDDEAISNAGF